MQREEYIKDEQVVSCAKAAVRLAIEKKKVMQIPIVTYDSNTKKIYQTDSNGNKIVIGEKRGRYSERLKKA